MRHTARTRRREAAPVVAAGAGAGAGAGAEQITISLDGEPVRAAAGQTIAAALVASGRLSWRTTRGRGEPRGLFCGIGVCFDCLVTVNGTSSVRACLVEARDGDVLMSERATGHDDLAI
jgi:predicted molibdopterin-dependent oxidoreductase YjgC